MRTWCVRRLEREGKRGRTAAVGGCRWPAGKGTCCAQRAASRPLPCPGDVSLRLAFRNASLVGSGSSSRHPPAVGRCGGCPDSWQKRARGRTGIFPAVFLLPTTAVKQLQADILSHFGNPGVSRLCLSINPSRREG